MPFLLTRLAPIASLCLSFAFLSGISSAANAATDSPDPGLEQALPTETPTKVETPPDPATETLDITQPKVPTRDEKVQTTSASRETFYPYQTSISPRLGFIGYDQNNSSGRQLYLIGFAYMADSPLSEHWEIGADLISNSSGFFNAGKKWVFYQHSAFRPFAKLGMAIMVEPEKALGSFIDWRNYQVRAGGGLEYLLIAPMSARFDLETGIGLRGAWAAVVVGYSWAW